MWARCAPAKTLFHMVRSSHLTGPAACSARLQRQLQHQEHLSPIGPLTRAVFDESNVGSPVQHYLAIVAISITPAQFSVSQLLA